MFESDSSAELYAKSVRANQRRLSEALKPAYHFIVCGSGSSGAVVARRLAENPEVDVLLLEVGGSDEAPTVMRAEQWAFNLGTERDWGFAAEPSDHVNGRSIPLPMGKTLGGGSSINAMIWSQGHKSDWDFFAEESGDPRWNYESVLKMYKKIEDWHGQPDPEHRGAGGPVFVQSAPNPHPVASAMVAGALCIGIPSFASPNGAMMEGNGGAALNDLRVRDGKRLSVFRSYTYPYMDRPNLTVLTHAHVTKVVFEKKRAVGVQFIWRDKVQYVNAGLELVLSLGAINTPKVLMQSGIGDGEELRRHSIPLVQHLAGVGQNFQDHVAAASCIWEFPEAMEIRNNGSEAAIFWKSDPSLSVPDLQALQLEFPVLSPELNEFNPPTHSWCILAGLVRPKSRGFIKLTGPKPEDPVQIFANSLEHPDDVQALIGFVELLREVGNSAPLRPFVKREVTPGNIKGVALENFVRDAAVTYLHQTCTAKMGRDAMSVVDGQLKVYGTDGLRIADGSIMPRVTTGNTMAPCVIIAERAAELIRDTHGLR